MPIQRCIAFVVLFWKFYIIKLTILSLIIQGKGAFVKQHKKRKGWNVKNGKKCNLSAKVGQKDLRDEGRRERRRTHLNMSYNFRRRKKNCPDKGCDMNIKREDFNSVSTLSLSLSLSLSRMPKVTKWPLKTLLVSLLTSNKAWTFKLGQHLFNEERGGQREKTYI